MRGFRRIGLFGLGAVLWGCGLDVPVPPRTAASLQLVSAAQLDGTPGWKVPDTVVVRALDGQGHPLSGAHLTWVVVSGNGAVTPTADTTDGSGFSKAVWQLGTPEGIQEVGIGSGSATPVAVSATATTLHATALTSGNGWNCVLDGQGKAWCWGANVFGVLGRGYSSLPNDTAMEVSGGLSFTMLSASKSDHICGLAAGGAAYCWGLNHTGQLGSAAGTDSIMVPTAVATPLRFTQISANGSPYLGTTCGRSDRGEVWCWGSNLTGQLGDSTLPSGPNNFSVTPVRVQTTETFRAVKVGFTHSCALSDSGALFCWGQQQGNNGAFGRHPPGVYPTPIAVATDYRFLDVIFGNDLTCGLTIYHQAYCWGLNWFGGLGSGQQIFSSADPVPVAGGLLFRSLANGSFEQLFGLNTLGQAYTWGSPECCDISQGTPLLLDPDLRFVVMDGQQFPFGACGITMTEAVYCSRWRGGRAKGVPVRR